MDENTISPEIIEKYGTRPDVLAEKLSEVTGFKIVLPED